MLLQESYPSLVIPEMELILKMQAYTTIFDPWILSQDVVLAVQ